MQEQQCATRVAACPQKTSSGQAVDLRYIVVFRRILILFIIVIIASVLFSPPSPSLLCMSTGQRSRFARRFGRVARHARALQARFSLECY